MHSEHEAYIRIAGAGEQWRSTHTYEIAATDASMTAKH
jgi:hypothetical protein